MDNEHKQRLDDAEQRGHIRQQEAGERYQSARVAGSLEGERSALLSLELQTLQNRFERLERRVTGLEDEIANLRSGRRSEAT